MQPLTKKSLKFCFSNSLEQIIKSSTRNTDKTETFIDHVLTNSSERVSQSNVLSRFIRSWPHMWCVARFGTICTI